MLAKRPKTQIVETTFDGGVLRPIGPLSLREHERVRVIAQSGEFDAKTRGRAFERPLAGIRTMNFRSSDGYPARGDLHERR